jgi:CBS domain
MCRTVEDVMTREVMCAHEDTRYKDLVKLLAARRVSAVPGVDDRRHVLGVASEADLLFKQHKPARPGIGLLSALRRREGPGQGPSDRCCGADEPAGSDDRPGATLTEAVRRLHAAGSSGCRWSIRWAGWSGSSAGWTC